MNDYYARKWVDGSFATKSDREAEDLVKRTVEVAWGCELHKYADFDHVDFWLEHGNRTGAYIEVKSRSVTSDTYPDVFLNLCKWYSLIDISVRTDVPAYFFVCFADCIKYINVALVDARELEIGGCSHRVKSENDREPVIMVPISDMETMDKCLAE